MIAVAVADDHHHRGAGVQRLHQAGDQIGRTRPEGRIAQSDAAGDFGVGIGDEDRRAFIVDQMMIQPEAAGGIVKWQQLKAAHPEHGAAMKSLDHAGERLAPGEFVSWRMIEGHLLVHA